MLASCLIKSALELPWLMPATFLNRNVKLFIYAFKIIKKYYTISMLKGNWKLLCLQGLGRDNELNKNMAFVVTQGAKFMDKKSCIQSLTSEYPEWLWLYLIFVQLERICTLGFVIFSTWL